MRDPNRIPHVLEEIREIWEKYPDLRLGQLLLNTAERANMLYYIEDDALVQALKRLYDDKGKE